MPVSCESFVLSDRGLCDGPIPRPKQFYRVWCISPRVISKPPQGGGLGPSRAVAPPRPKKRGVGL